MIDLFEKCHGDGGYFGFLRVLDDTYFVQPVLEGPPGPHMRFRGKEVIQWAINSYLGLTGNEEIRDTALESVKKWGTYSPMGSRMLTGNNPRHLEVEQKFADYMGKERAILFNYGYLGVIGTIASLIGKDDQIVIDRLSHACMIDGATLASAKGRKAIPFRHNDLNHLEEILKGVRDEVPGGVLIVAEGVYGMRGDMADLKGICELKEKYGARLFIDDAHGFGIMGPKGLGAAAEQGVQDKVDLYLSTFAKSYAAIGAVMGGPKAAIEYVRFNARSNVFAKSLPMVYVDVVDKTLDLIRDGDALRARTWEVAHKLQNGFKALGFDIGDTVTPITPVYVPTGSEQQAMLMVKTLRERFGIFVSGVSFPVVPKGVIMFRMIPTAAHSDEDVEKTLEAFKQMRDMLKLDLSTRPSQYNE